MSEEERQRQMDFIVNQQAQFTANIQQLQEVQIAAEQRMTRLESVVVRLANDTETKFAALADSHIRLVDAQTHTEAALARLADAQAHTDQRLDALIDIVREGRQNGQP